MLRLPGELESIRNLWTNFQTHPESDFDFFLQLVRLSKAASQPYVMVIDAGGECVALLTGLVQAASFDISFAGRVLWRCRVRQLSFSSGSFMGQTDERISSFTVRQLSKAMLAEKVDLLTYHNLNWHSHLRRCLLSEAAPWCRDLLARPRNHWVISLPASLEEFLQKQLNKKRRYWAKRMVRQLEKSFPGRSRFVRFSGADDLPRLLRDASVVARQSHLWGKGVGYRESEEQREQIALFARKGSLRAIILYVDDLPVSYWIAFRCQRSLYLYYTGYVPEFHRFEPGTLALFQIISDACREGLELIYMGAGPFEYQRKYSNSPYPDSNVLMFAATPRAVTLNLARMVFRGPLEIVRRAVTFVGLGARLSAH